MKIHIFTIDVRVKIDTVVQPLTNSQIDKGICIDYKGLMGGCLLIDTR
jgi:hypothetical protein